MTRAIVVASLFACVASAEGQQAGWRDPSPHTVLMIAVEPAVELEVLDWGGSGPAIILLAGLSNTAHVYDDFAPLLTSHFRVLGITRRGHGRSTAPASGYTPQRLAEDVIRVMDAEQVKRAIVVGHSFAGEEMHVLGAKYVDRISGLVYIDAAFDRADTVQKYETALAALPHPIGSASCR